MLIAFLIIWQMIHQPWLGLSFIAPSKGDGLVVASVDKNGPAFNLLERNQHIRLIKGAHDSVLLNRELLKATDIFPTYKAFNAYLAAHQRVADILGEHSVTFVLDNGQSIVVTPDKRHTVSAIPIIYFFYLLSGFFCFGIGLLLWWYRRNLFVTRLVLIAGIGSLVYYLSAVLQYRELALSADWLYITSVTSIAGSNISVWGCFAVFMAYPLRGFDNRVIWVLLLLILLLVLNNTLQWMEFPFHAYMFQFALMGLGIYVLLFWQWRLTRQRPVERAIVKLFIVTMTAPTLLVILLWMIPIILGKPTWILHELARFIFAPIAFGWAIAIFRYKLFNIEKWWLISVIWLLGIMVVMVPYGFLVYFMNFPSLPTFCLALIVGWALYFPIGQRFILGLLPELSGSIDDTSSQLIHSLQTATTDTDFQNAWQKTLETRFCPIAINFIKGKQGQVTFSNEGQALHVPNIVGESSYALLGKSQGERLFNLRDVKAIESLLMLAQAILRASRAREEATLVERTRIMRDLHDSLGAKLLSMVQRSNANADDAREALQTLRDTVHLSMITQLPDLPALLGEWRMETRERVEITHARLHWQVDIHEDEPNISATQLMLLRSFLREAISNALKHAQPENVFVRIEQSSVWLKMRVGNDGCVTAPETWKLGFGLSHLRERLGRAGGKLEISQLQTDGCGATLEVSAVLSLVAQVSNTGE
ncbi:MAG: hypothetical protein H6936_02340 [Burkholderiales bacterium]|nr:hypothetical protein [Nitrosomonas sp.]MCP5273694.1 hypothetical protein [Burkholderiales bacterium]